MAEDALVTALSFYTDNAERVPSHRRRAAGLSPTSRPRRGKAGIA